VLKKKNANSFASKAVLQGEKKGLESIITSTVLQEMLQGYREFFKLK
jgi:hypothetical protein